MDATFRMRRSYRNEYAACLLGFLAWGVLGSCAALMVPSTWPIEPDARLPLALAAGGIPLVMAGFALWGLVTYRRRELTIRGDRISLRGVFRRTELDLNEVTAARWMTRLPHDSLVLRSGPARIPLRFAYYEPEESARIIHHVRSVLQPEVQLGWNLFAYKSAYLQPRSPRRKPGPDEILVRRERWTRFFMPMLLVAGLAGILAWWSTRELRFFAFPLLGLLLLWALIRAATPAEGAVHKKLSAMLTPDTAGFFCFQLLWFLVAVAGIAVHAVFRPRQEYPDTVVIVGAAIWFGAFMFESALHDRRRAHREREAADLSAKARGETGANAWPTD
jgi:hypothetical protein